jgi:DUF971 family protein
MDDKIRPTGVTADRTKRVVTIEWNDGSSCDYSFAGLRAVCPCASCRGGHENMGQPADKWLLQQATDDGLTLDGLEPVGSYAIMFQWGDGHSTGIYTWDYLYNACH